MTSPAWIGLGSNLGDRRAILIEAVDRLARTPGVAVGAISTHRETRAVGGPPGQGPFLNAAARLDTTLSPRELLGALQAVERDLGRVRAARWGERTLDLDLLIYGAKFVDEPDLKLSHPRLAVRRFVLEPLAEIAPDIVDTTTRRTVADLLANLDRTPRCVMLDRSAPGQHHPLAGRIAGALGGTAVTLRPIAPGRLAPELCRGRWSRHRDELARAETLQAMTTGSSTGRDRWSVCDFSLDVTRTRASCSADRVLALDDATIARAAVEEPRIWFGSQIARALVGVTDATLIVSLDEPRSPRKAGMSHTPVYRPEATGPDAIVDEVAAVCLGIASG